MDWEVAKWAKTRGTGSTAFSNLLAVDGVYKALGLSYCNSAELNHIIDTEIPARRPAFIRKEVECIRALYGFPDHVRYLCVSPERHYSNAKKTQRLYHDMHTGKWWWNTQVQLEQDKPGATIVPSAYPVYLTIGNLPKEVQRKPSQQAQILLAYLPTTRLQHLPTKAARRRAVSNLFHACMGSILAPLKSAGIDGIIMTSGDGVRQRCHPILTAYIGDYPEQMLVSCGYYGHSSICMVAKHELGEYPCTAEYHDAIQAIEVAHLIGTDEWAQSCAAANMKPVQHPFWEDLPYTDIFCSITPNLLHQLYLLKEIALYAQQYQGVMKHLIKWITANVGAGEVDARHGMRHFHKGITTLSRVSGTKHKQMCMFLLSLVIDVPRLAPAKSRRLITATRSLLDFLYMSSFPIHSDESLTSVDAALALFHENKHIFIELGAREHFDIPKIHFLYHYVRAFKLFGTSDNYNTETTEHLHIDFAKDAYRASNCKDEYSQMTKWLERREKVNYHARSQKTLHDMQCPLTQHFTKFPTVKTVSISKLEERSLLGYGATQFEYALKRFISQFCNPEFTPAEVDKMASFLSLPFRGVPVWHRMKFRNKDLYGKKTLDVVSAHSARRCQIGRVRAIFSLPKQYLNQLFPANVTPPVHLAYVEWFTKFTQRPEPYSLLYHVKPQFCRDGSLGPVERLRRGP
ncbi:hypothetical protein C8J55DRAFT_537034 [Lentinula edodes]|uniref:Uncharacterized protein n=1 Tax=Lentinula lateritia TaxID=40482 RepID=A0A9W9A6Q8_9AGAR|nr:hypothetical protein C8J55DRAFT_537034 [Lentinula edodes]